MRALHHQDAELVLAADIMMSACVKLMAIPLIKHTCRQAQPHSELATQIPSTQGEQVVLKNTGWFAVVRQQLVGVKADAKL
jgi:hypothetical protein